MRFKTLALLLLAALAVRASDNIPAVRPGKPTLLRGATVHTVTGADLPKTDVLMRDGKIAAIGANLAPGDATVVDVAGKHIYPGLISAFSGMGLVEVNSVKGSVDLAETGQLNPNARAQSAINPETDLIPVSRSNGILTALSVPLSSGLIAGTSTLIRMDGWTYEDLTIRPAVAMHVWWPNMVVNREPNARPVADQERVINENLKHLREAFATARAYKKAREGAAGTTDFDSRWEAMLPVFRGELPVFVHANEIRQIEAAVAWAKTEKLKITIVGGLDAWRAIDLLKANDIAVIVSPVLTLPLRREDPFDASYANAGKLQAAGIRFCIANDGENAELGTMADRNLPYQAGKAAAYGLPPAEALKAITLYPAQLLGVDKELGSIEIGKRATLIVTDGDPIEIPTHVEQAYIDGAKIDLSNKHTRLYEKYEERMKQQKKS